MLLCLRKIIKTVATGYRILRLRCTNFGWTVLSIPSCWGPTTKGGQGRKVEMKRRGSEGRRMIFYAFSSLAEA